MNRQPVPARVSAPGSILEKELKARGWTQKEFALMIKRPPQVISETVRGKRVITPGIASNLAEVFGTSAEFWSNLDTGYRNSLV